MTELGVKGTLCGIGGSMGPEVLGCAEKQASRGPGVGGGRENGFQASVCGLLTPPTTPTPVRSSGAQMKWELEFLWWTLQHYGLDD